MTPDPTPDARAEAATARRPHPRPSPGPAARPPTPFDTTLPYDEVPAWAGRATVIGTSRARKDLDPDRPDVRPGFRHVGRVLRSLYAGRPTVLYSVCPNKLDLVAVVIARALFPHRIGTVLLTGDMWEPGHGWGRRALGVLIRFCDRSVAAWVVHTEDDKRCFVDVWRVPESKVAVAPACVTPDWRRHGRRRADRPYVFVGGNSLRDFSAILAAARELPEVDFVFATTAVGPDQVPPNVELIGVDRPGFQRAMTGSRATVVPLRAGIRRSAGQQTYLNAMRAGSVPIVVDGPGVAEHITHGVDGLIVDGSQQAFVSTLRWVLDPANTDAVDGIRLRAIERARRLPPEFHALTILDVLDRLVPAPSARPGVAMLIQGYLPVVGGAQRQLAQLLPLLDDAGLRSTVITRAAPDLARSEPVGGGRVERVGLRRGPGPLRSLAFTAGALRRLRRLRPDVIQAFDLLSPTTTALVAKALFGVPVVVKVLRGGAVGDLARLRTKPLGRLRLRLMRRGIDRLIVISDEIERELLAAGFGHHQLVRIHNGVDLDRFSPPTAEDRAAQRAALGLGDGPVVIFTGRLEAEKGVDLLLDQWPPVVEKEATAVLLVVGDGPDRAGLAAHSSAPVRFTGPVEDVSAYLRAADAFVLPSSAEGLSNSLLEAMATGLAVVCTQVGGALDVIEHGGNGLLVPVGDGAALRDALIEAVTDGERRRRLGAEARATMVERFSLLETARRQVELFSALAGQSQRADLPTADDPLPAVR